jgi:hypothetical protein
MRNLIVMAASALALALTAGVAGATLVPSVYDPGNTGCPVSTYSNGVLHLAKNCPTPTLAAAQAGITGFTGATFTSASFTLANVSQCHGGSPRFNVYTSVQQPFFLGCNNVTPVVDPTTGAATYTFNAATIAAAGGQVPVPSGTISQVEIVLDVEGAADLTNITFNGVVQVPVPQVGPPTSKNACKNGGWKTFTTPKKFKNQGQCVSYVASHGHKQHNKH